MRLLVKCSIVVCVLSSLAVGQSSAEDSQASPGIVRVAVYEGTGVGRSIKDLIAVLDTFTDIQYERITADEIREGRLNG